MKKVTITEIRPIRMVKKSCNRSKGFKNTFLSGKIISMSARGTSWNRLMCMFLFRSSCKNQKRKQSCPEHEVMLANQYLVMIIISQGCVTVEQILESVFINLT